MSRKPRKELTIAEVIVRRKNKLATREGYRSLFWRVVFIAAFANRFLISHQQRHFNKHHRFLQHHLALRPLLLRRILRPCLRAPPLLPPLRKNTPLIPAIFLRQEKLLHFPFSSSFFALPPPHIHRLRQLRRQVPSSFLRRRTLLHRRLQLALSLAGIHCTRWRLR